MLKKAFSEKSEKELIEEVVICSKNCLRLRNTTPLHSVTEGENGIINIKKGHGL